MLSHSLRRLAGTALTALALGTAACGGDNSGSTGPEPAPADVSGTYDLTGLRTLGNLGGGGAGLPVTFTDGGGSTLRFESGYLELLAGWELLPRGRGGVQWRQRHHVGRGDLLRWPATPSTSPRPATRLGCGTASSAAARSRRRPSSAGSPSRSISRSSGTMHGATDPMKAGTVEHAKVVGRYELVGVNGGLLPVSLDQEANGSGTGVQRPERRAPPRDRRDVRSRAHRPVRLSAGASGVRTIASGGTWRFLPSALDRTSGEIRLSSGEGQTSAAVAGVSLVHRMRPERQSGGQAHWVYIRR